MASQNGQGRNTGAGDGERRRRRNLLIAGLSALAILAFGGGILLAQDDGDGAASPSPTASRSPDPTEEPTATPSASGSATVTPSASASASASPVLEDGRHFVYPKGAISDDPWSLTFDLAYFFKDQEALDECGPDVPNGYCIVNDNAKLRTLSVAETVTVRYIPNGSCCALKSGGFPPLAEAVNGTAPTDYDPAAPYWITVQGEQVIRISQQFLP